MSRVGPAPLPTTSGCGAPRTSATSTPTARASSTTSDAQSTANAIRVVDRQDRGRTALEIHRPPAIRDIQVGEWQQQGSDADAAGDFDAARDVGAIFRTRPTNVFAIKATHWLGP